MWMQRIKESPSNKKLSLIYLANEIVQQSKIRKKDEFLKAFDPIIVEATSAAYKGSASESQNKIRRVVEVWRQRQVFNPTLQGQIEASIDEIDRSRSSRKPALGGNLFSSSSVPPELSSVAPLATTLQKADLNAKPAITAANQDYEKLTNPNNSIPSPPMHAAGLAALVKKLATAEGAVAESIKARRALITGLEKLLETNKTKLSAEEAQVTDFNARKNAIESRKREVEEAILKGLSAADTHAISAAPLSVLAGARPSNSTPPVRPDIEELTPPPMESFTPVGSPRPAAIPNDVFPEPVSNPIEPVAVPAPFGVSSIPQPQTILGQANPIPGVDLASLLSHVKPDDGLNGHGITTYHDRTFKKRKMSRNAAEDEFAAFAGDGDVAGIDNDVGNLI